MLYAEQTAAGRQSPGLNGNYTTSEAAGKLLAGSGPIYRVAADGTVTVKPASKPDTTTLAPMTVYGNAGANDPFNESYTVTNSSIATKTDTPIMDTPVSIQVVTRAVMNDQQAIQLRDVTKNFSGVQPGASDANYNNAFIVRGFDLGNNTYRNGFRINFSQSETVNLERLRY